MKKIAMLLVTAGTIGMLTGCGIPEEEHNMIIQNLETEHTAKVDQLNSALAEQKDLLEKEQAKVRSTRIELDDATERIKDLQQKSAEMTKAVAAQKTKMSGLAAELKSVNAKLAAAQERATTAETEYSTLDVKYQELERRFEMFKKNIGSIGNQAGSTASPAEPSTPEASSEPKTDADKASSLLDQMGTM